MKLYELIKVLSDTQDEITLIFPENNNAHDVYSNIHDISITYVYYKVTNIHGYDASGYDGIEISLVKE